MNLGNNATSSLPHWVRTLMLKVDNSLMLVAGSRGFPHQGFEEQRVEGKDFGRWESGGGEWRKTTCQGD